MPVEKYEIENELPVKTDLRNNKIEFDENLIPAILGDEYECGDLIHENESSFKPLCQQNLKVDDVIEIGLL